MKFWRGGLETGRAIAPRVKQPASFECVCEVCLFSVGLFVLSSYIVFVYVFF